MLQSYATMSGLLALQNKLAGTHAWLAQICMYCSIMIQPCAATVSSIMSSEKGAGGPTVCVCLQAALDKLREVISQQHHLPPIAAVQQLQTATATPPAETTALSSVDQVQRSDALQT